jgi:hypothetical protein
MKANELPQMKIRLTPELKALLEESASEGGRTLNAEVTLRLEATFKDGSAAGGMGESQLRKVLREELREALFWAGANKVKPED